MGCNEIISNFMKYGFAAENAIVTIISFAFVDYEIVGEDTTDLISGLTLDDIRMCIFTDFVGYENS